MVGGRLLGREVWGGGGGVYEVRLGRLARWEPDRRFPPTQGRNDKEAASRRRKQIGEGATAGGGGGEGG